MHAKVFLRLLLFALNYAVTPANSSPRRNVFSINSEPILLTCEQEGYNHFPFAWRNTVYNEGREPSTIYNSSIGEIEKDYAERGFQISDRTLKVQDKKDDMSGYYFCEIYLTNGTNLTVPYYVWRLSTIECTKDLEAEEGAAITLECNYESSYSSKPYWTDGKEEIRRYEYQSEFTSQEINATLEAASHHDGATFRCMLENAEICSLKIRVKYKVKEILLPDTSKNFHPGDNITCQASGNPMPNLTLTLEGMDQRKVSGLGLVSLSAGEDLIGKKVKVVCEAWNMINGVRTNISKESHLFVAEKPLKSGNVEASDTNGLLIIIGVIIAIILSVIILVIAIMVCNRKKGKKEASKQKDDILLKHEQKKNYNSDMI